QNLAKIIDELFGTSLALKKLLQFGLREANSSYTWAIWRSRREGLFTTKATNSVNQRLGSRSLRVRFRNEIPLSFRRIRQKPYLIFGSQHSVSTSKHSISFEAIV